MTEQIVKKGFVKFAASVDAVDANKFGITNSRNEVVTDGYLRRYIQCWCRQEHGFVKDRKANFEYFMSGEFLSQQVGKTASQVGKAASISDRWGIVRRPAIAGEPPAVITSMATAVVNGETPVESEPEVSNPVESLAETQAHQKRLRKNAKKIEELTGQIAALRATADDPAAAETIEIATRELELLYA
jgi:hypothetical protein